MLINILIPSSREKKEEFYGRKGILVWLYAFSSVDRISTRELFFLDMRFVSPRCRLPYTWILDF